MAIARFPAMAAKIAVFDSLLMRNTITCAERIKAPKSEAQRAMREERRVRALPLCPYLSALCSFPPILNFHSPFSTLSGILAPARPPEGSFPASAVQTRKVKLAATCIVFLCKSKDEKIFTGRHLQ